MDPMGGGMPGEEGDGDEFDEDQWAQMLGEGDEDEGDQGNGNGGKPPQLPPQQQQQQQPKQLTAGAPPKPQPGAKVQKSFRVNLSL